MRVSKAQVGRWYHSYRQFLFTRVCRTAPIAVILFIGVIGSIFAPRGSTVSRLFNGLIGFTVGALFVLGGVYAMLLGLFGFCERQNVRIAICSLLAGFGLGVLLVICGVGGFLQLLR